MHVLLLGVGVCLTMHDDKALVLGNVNSLVVRKSAFVTF